MRVSVSIVLLSLLYGISSVPINASRICASKKKNIENISLKYNSHGIEDVSRAINLLRMQTNQLEVTFETCNNFCYALWQEEKHANGSRIIILLQGCWKQSGERKCDNTECVALKGSSKALNNTKFCCCNGDYCNQNITDTLDVSYAQNEVTQVFPETTGFLERPESEKWMMIIGSIVVGSLVLVCAIMLVYRAYRGNIMGKMKKPLSYGDGFMDSTSLRTGTYTVDHLKLASIVGQGRYGSVWQGSMGDRDVAVKIFPSHYRNYFQNERDTYRLPFMEHPSLLSYYGVDERLSMEGNIDYLLVLSYAPRGTLTDFLRAQTVDWITFCKMGLSIVKGLAYLHTDIRKGDKLKPCIAHRDMNSRNILIKNDGTCCICDLGLAVQISGSKYFSNGEEQHAETKSINDVGTLRYMAPEVLEGAVNLRDCESSLKQIDVYAMGLILWEIVSRCSDIYIPGSEVPAYKQPFEMEIGLHPTFEGMQVLVSRNKARPLLEANLVDRPGVRLIKETMEDCWDADGEARLTALCIEERLTELQSQRVTVYSMDGSPMVNSYSTLVPAPSSSQYSDVCYLDNIHAPTTDIHARQDGARNEITADNTTVVSSFEPIHAEHNCKNSNETALSRHSQAALQPYQGRNPCMERNLMLASGSRDELGSNARVLVDRSSKHVTADQYKLPSELQALVAHEYPARNAIQLSQPRPATPIPYVQNVITENGLGQCNNRRKQTNMPDNYCRDENPPRCKRFAGWSGIKRLLSQKNKKMYPYAKCRIDREDSKSNLLTKQQRAPFKTVETNVTISPAGKYVNGVVSKNCTREKSATVTIGAPETTERPCSLSLVDLSLERTDNNLARQESLDKFNEVFNVRSNSIALKHPNMRIKTPGDLPPSVRKVRGGRGHNAARFSLYDDRMMCNIFNERDGDYDNKNNMSNSVPFGIDCNNDDLERINDDKSIGAKNVTCF